MKFMMNGALTVGTATGDHRDGRGGGEENFFLFGLTAEQVANSPDFVQPALALRTRAGNPGGIRPDLRRPLQPP